MRLWLVFAGCSGCETYSLRGILMSPPTKSWLQALDEKTNGKSCGGTGVEEWLVSPDESRCVNDSYEPEV